MNHNTIFTVLFTLFLSLFTFSACDDGGSENNNNLTVDQDVRDWCAEWLYCSDESWGGHIPYSTQEDCEQIMQWVKNNKDNEPWYMLCYDPTLGYTGPQTCGDIDIEWGAGADCSYTPYGACAESREGVCGLE